MKIEKTEVFKFDREELQYPWLAALIHDWLIDLAESKGAYDPTNFGNEEAFKDFVYAKADAFKRMAEDNFGPEGPDRFTLMELAEFGTRLDSLWRA